MIARVAVALVASLWLATGAAAPASADPAAACEGVRVVVDYNELGGETRSGCVPPGTAAEAFAAAEVRLEYAPQLQDFVCRVSGVPASGPCTDGTSYWSLWWSDGDTEWSYATLSVRSLEVPAGGAVGFAWHEGADEATPPDSSLGGPAELNDDPASDAEDADAPDSAGTDGPEGPDGEDIVGEGDDSLPWWAVTVVAAIVLGGALVPLLRRRRS